MPDKIDQVPLFTLYGEHNLEDNAEFIHIEHIASRSRSNDWKIKPHRHGRMLQLIAVYTGTIKANLDDRLVRSDQPCCIVIPPGVVHSFEFAPETQGVVLTVAESILLQEEQERCRPYFEHLLSHTDLITFDPRAQLLRQLETYLDLLHREFRSLYAGRLLMCEWLVRMVLMTLSRQLSHHGAVEQETGELVSTLHRFRQLVEAHYNEHWKVDDYARALNVTPNRLNRLCRTGMHRNAKSLLQERVILEAKRKLIYTHGNIDQIAFDLGFSDPGYFSRFFKQHTGIAPREYRESH